MPFGIASKSAQGSRLWVLGTALWKKVVSSKSATPIVTLASVLIAASLHASQLPKAKHARDGLVYVRLKPGTFIMGCVPGDSSCTPEERPARSVSLTRSVWISQTEVTIEAFAIFADATRYRTRAEQKGEGRFWPNDAGWQWVSGLTWRTPLVPNVSGDREWPAVQVSWADSDAFCRWTGGRLPTEAEWEYAARGGRAGERFPWGNAPTPAIGQTIQANGPDERTRRRFPLWEIFTSFDDAYEMLAPVGRFAPNGFGLFDMAGNAWEWVADWYSPNAYATLPAVDPQGPESGTARVVRGGSWGYAPRQLRSSERGWAEPEFWTATFGFRCVLDQAP